MTRDELIAKWEELLEQAKDDNARCNASGLGYAAARSEGYITAKRCCIDDLRELEAEK